MVVTVKMHGVHKMVKRLASGKVVEYHYAWRGGPRIMAKAGTKAYLAEYLRLTKFRERANGADTLGALTSKYRKSERFTSLRPVTQKSYARIIDQINAKFGDLELIAVEAKGSRTLFLEWLSEWRNTPRMADLMRSVFARILSFGVDREAITRNPLTAVGRLSKGSRKDIIWPVETLNHYIANGQPHLVEVVINAIWTMQRQADCLGMVPMAFDGERVRIKQFKTGALVWVRPAPQLLSILQRSKDRRQVRVHLNSRGLKWTGDGFRASLSTDFERLGITGLTFHDLRGSAITYAYAAMTKNMPHDDAIKEIAMISGHSEADANAIIKRYYLAGDGVIKAIQAAIA